MSIPHWAEEIRLRDRDRFLCALLAPDDKREDLLALYAFNGEIARIRETVSEPLLGNIRLQWWRETLEAIYEKDKAPNHEVAQALFGAIKSRNLPRKPFETLLDAREFDMQDTPPEDMQALIAYAQGTSSTLQELACRILSGEAAGEAAKEIGVAWALTGLMRAVPYQASAGRTFLPKSDLVKRELDYLHLSPSEKLNEVVEGVANHALGALKRGREHRSQAKKEANSAMLLAAITESYLKLFKKAAYNPFDARLHRGGTVRQLKIMWYAMLKKY